MSKISSHTKKNRLIDLIDEHIDHLNYLQDIYMINNQGLSNCLSEQIVRRLFVPVYLSSLLNKEKFVIKVNFHSLYTNRLHFLTINIFLF